MIFSVTLNPCVDHVVFLETLTLGDTNRVIHTETDAGGKGVNLSRVAAEMGAATVASGFLGGGEGAYVRHVLDRERVPHDFVEIAGETRTNFSVEDESGNPPTTFNAKGPDIAPIEWRVLLEKTASLLSGADWLAVGGSLPPGLPADAFGQLVALGIDAGVKVLLDADGEPQRIALGAGPHFIKPNASEAARLLNRPVKTREQALAAARELHSRLSEQRGKDAIVVVSRGADGAVLVCAEGTFVGISPPVESRSTIGSGDSLLGAMLARLGKGDLIQQAFRWGLAAGAATATTDGSEIGRHRVIELLWTHASVKQV